MEYAFLFLGASFLSLWISKDIKIWGSLLGLTLACGLLAGNLNGTTLIVILLLAFFWFLYQRKPHFLLFLLLILLSIPLKMHLLPGYAPLMITPRLSLDLERALIGFFPLALLIPLAKSLKDWTLALKGLMWGLLGIALMALLATFLGATHLQPKWPTAAAIRILSNLFLTSIPEEGFYRGFIQHTLGQYWGRFKGGKILALFLTSILFTAAHVYWSPNILILSFVFIASLLYGGVYLISHKIESAILCHFFLNIIHMTFFTYHAM